MGHAHFMRLHVSPQLFCTEWYYTVFAYILPLPLVLRVWDVFLTDGTKALHRFALTILSRIKPRLLQTDYETTVMRIKSVRDDDIFISPEDERPGDSFIRDSFKYKVTNRSLHKLTQELLKIAKSQDPPPLSKN